jgi:hypothetical protein
VAAGLIGAPGSPRRAGPREEARHGRTPSPARVRPEEGDDGRAPPGSGCRRREAAWADCWAEVGCDVRAGSEAKKERGGE